MTRLELLWWVGWAWLAAWTALPLLLLPWTGPFAGLVLACVLAPWTALAGIAAVQRVLRDVEPGHYRMFADPGSVRWAVKGWAPAVFLTLFQPLFFKSSAYQRIALRLLGARLGPGARVTSRTVLLEPHLVSIGARSLLGEHVHVICSYQPRPGLLVVGRVAIGDDVLVGGYSHLGPGCEIGSGTVIGYDVKLEPRVRIGSDCHIGAGAVLHRGACIGNGVRIGKSCRVPEHARIPDGAVITDHTAWEAAS